MIYEIQEPLINGQWETISYTTCFKTALGLMGPKQRIVDMKSKEVIVHLTKQGLIAFPNHVKILKS